MRQRRTTETTSVFLDRSGRRRRLVRLVGVCLGVSLVAVLAVLTAAVFGAGPSRIPGFPDVAGKPRINATVGPTTPGGSELRLATPGVGVSPSYAPSALGVTPVTSTTKPGRVPTQTPSHPTKTKSTPPHPTKTN